MVSKPDFPKKDAIYVRQITLDADDRADILSDLGWDTVQLNQLEKDSIIERLENLLSMQFHRFAGLGDKPLLANVRVVLEEIVPAAERLAAIMKDYGTSTFMRKFLGQCNPGKLWHDLTELANNASVGIDIIKTSDIRSDGGERRKLARLARENIKSQLLEFFESHRNKDVAIETFPDDFLSICQNHLPKQ